MRLAGRSNGWQEMVRGVIEAYWNLVYAIQALNAAKNTVAHRIWL